MKKAWIPLLVATILVCGIGGFAVSRFQGAKPSASVDKTTKVTRGNLVVPVVESGAVDAVKSVEVRSQVTGRLMKLMVDEGDTVKAGQLVAVIDQQPTEIQLRQSEAQLSGAQSAEERARLEIIQRRQTAQAEYQQAQARVDQLRIEANAQPSLTRAAIAEAETALQVALQARRRYTESVHPNQVVTARTAVDEAKASRESAQLEYTRQVDLERQGYSATKNVEVARANLQLAQARLESAQENAARLAAVQGTETATADQNILQARAALNRARVNAIQNTIKQKDYQTAVADLAKAKAALEDTAILEQGRRQSAATVAQLQSSVDDSRRQLGETEIRAPIDGVVTARSIQVGEMVTGLSTFGSGTTIIKIEDRDAMRVKLNINEIDTAKLALGMNANIDIDALPRKKFTGVVTKIAPASIQSVAASGTPSADSVVRYQVEIQIDGKDHDLRSGLTAKCTINVVERPNALVLPIAYIQKKGRQAFVFLPPAANATPDAKTGKAAPVSREVKIGAESGSQVEILEGLKEGEAVVLPPFDGPERKSMISVGTD